MNSLLLVDQSIFFLINNLPHPWYLDQLFLFFSFYPVIIWALIGIVLVIVEERKEKLFIVRLMLALLVSGFIASGIIKPMIQRPRPDISHGEKVVNIAEKPATIPWNNDFAFPSGHAAVAFAGAYIVMREETRGKHAKKHHKKKRKYLYWAFLAIAFLTAFSRIYLGKHYPLDVIAGGFIGWFVGLASWKVVDIIQPPKAY